MIHESTRPRYHVLTWDADSQTFTPQPGVRRGPWTLFGLRRALRRLQGMAYDTGRNSPSVFVYREDVQPKGDVS